MINILVKCGRKHPRRNDDTIAMRTSVDKPAKWRAAPHVASPDKCPVICLGDGNFDCIRFRGKSHGHVKLLRQKLRQAQKQGRLIVVDVAEGYTSKTCSTCGRCALENVKVFLPFQKVYALHAVVFCNKCRRMW
ncbi:hypothetical protein BC940DRAFT_50408 [Gongronella butleri]|nr:hypothetical protein BC940DRAFT_50408 [Gongronella butleri]